MIGYEFLWGINKSGLMADADSRLDFPNSRHGFYWWFWLPRFHGNGGKFGRDVCIDWTFNFLCYSLNFTFFKGRKRK